MKLINQANPAMRSDIKVHEVVHRKLKFIRVHNTSS